MQPAQLHGSRLHEAVPQQEKLRQDEVYEHDGDYRADADILPDARDDDLRHAIADDESGDDHHRAGGDDRRERKVQRVDYRIALGHLPAQLVIARGDDDGVVDVRAHLYRADDEVAHEEHVVAAQDGDREVYPDAALNDQDQQQRHSERTEGKEQYQHDEPQRHQAHDHVVADKGVVEVACRHGVAGEVHAALGVILRSDEPCALEEIKGVVALHRQIDVQQETAVILTLQLHGCYLKLRVKILDQRYLLLAERHGTVITHIVQEEEQIDQRHFVAGQIVARVSVLVLTCRVVREERLTCYGVHARNAGKFGVIHHVAELIAVYRVDIRDAEGVIHLRAGLKLRDELGLFFIAAGRNDNDHKVIFTEALMYGVRGDVLLVLALGVDKIHGVSIIAAAECEICSDDEQHEQRRDYKSRGICELARKVDLRHEVLVLRFIHELAAAHEQRRHQQEH